MRSIGIGSVALVMACVLGAVCFHVTTAAQKEVVQASEKLDGKWYVVRQEQFGGAVPATVAKRLNVVIDGAKMEWYIGNPAPNMAATLTVDPEKKTMDAKVTRGSLNGKTMLGIYKLEGDTLKVCFDDFGKKRPTEFKAKADSKQSIYVLKREKKKDK